MALDIVDVLKKSVNPGQPGVIRSANVPTNIWPLLSPTNSAGECFVNQRFSGSLQAFMVAYVNTVYSNYSVYQE